MGVARSRALDLERAVDVDSCVAIEGVRLRIFGVGLALAVSDSMREGVWLTRLAARFVRLEFSRTTLGLLLLLLLRSPSPVELPL